jgi:hypothetical protein
MTTDPSPLDLENLLQGAIDTYEHERKETWHQDDRGKEYLALFDGIAKWMLRSSQDLVARPVASGLNWGSAIRLLGVPELRTPIKERVQIDVAWQFATGTDEMAERCLELAQLVLASPPADPVLRYLTRLSRCYIAGFLPECVMLCRAVFENGIKDAFSRAGGPSPESMRKRIDQARERGWLTDEGRLEADAIWARGNKAVHQDPFLVQEVSETIAMMLRVLGQLSGAPGEGA